MPYRCRRKKLLHVKKTFFDCCPVNFAGRTLVFYQAHNLDVRGFDSRTRNNTPNDRVMM